MEQVSVQNKCLIKITLGVPDQVGIFCPPRRGQPITTWYTASRIGLFLIKGSAKSCEMKKNMCGRLCKLSVKKQTCVDSALEIVNAESGAPGAVSAPGLT